MGLSLFSTEGPEHCNKILKGLYLRDNNDAYALVRVLRKFHVYQRVKSAEIVASARKGNHVYGAYFEVKGKHTCSSCGGDHQCNNHDCPNFSAYEAMHVKDVELLDVLYGRGPVAVPEETDAQVLAREEREEEENAAYRKSRTWVAEQVETSG